METLIDRSKSDTIIDSREGNEAVRSKIQAAAGGRPIHHAYDVILEKGSYQNLAAVMTAPGKIIGVLPLKEGDTFPDGVTIDRMMVGTVHQSPTEEKTIDDREFGAVFFQLMSRGLAQGWFSGHPHEVRAGGLDGIEGALRIWKLGRLLP